MDMDANHETTDSPAFLSHSPISAVASPRVPDDADQQKPTIASSAAEQSTPMGENITMNDSAVTKAEDLSVAETTPKARPTPEQLKRLVSPPHTPYTRKQELDH